MTLLLLIAFFLIAIAIGALQALLFILSSQETHQAAHRPLLKLLP